MTDVACLGTGTQENRLASKADSTRQNKGRNLRQSNKWVQKDNKTNKLWGIKSWMKHCHISLSNKLSLMWTVTDVILIWVFAIFESQNFRSSLLHKEWLWVRNFFVAIRQTLAQAPVKMYNWVNYWLGHPACDANVTAWSLAYCAEYWVASCIKDVLVHRWKAAVP